MFYLLFWLWSKNNGNGGCRRYRQKDNSIWLVWYDVWQPLCAIHPMNWVELFYRITLVMTCYKLLLLILYNMYNKTNHNTRHFLPVCSLKYWTLLSSTIVQLDTNQMPFMMYTPSHIQEHRYSSRTEGLEQNTTASNTDLSRYQKWWQSTLLKVQNSKKLICKQKDKSNVRWC